MIWKTVVFACLLVGTFGDEIELDALRKAQIRQMLQAQCQKNNAADKVDDVLQAGTNFVDCVKGLVNVDDLKKEIEAARPVGALDEVFKKYCDKTPQLKTCIHNAIDGVTPCIDASAHSHINDAKNGTDQLIDFVCFKDGDRIALFISEQGPECFQEKASAIRECGQALQTSVGSVENARKLTDAERCAKLDVAAQCVVTALEGCSTPTPGNMAESLYRYMRKSSPCQTALPRE